MALQSLQFTIQGLTKDRDAVGACLDRAGEAFADLQDEMVWETERSILKAAGAEVFYYVSGEDVAV